MKRSFMGILFLFIVLVFTIPAQSSTITVDVAGMDNLLPDGIWSYQIEFTISGDTSWHDTDAVAFNTTDQHVYEVVPTIWIPNWNLAHSLVTAVSANKLVILTDEKDYGDKAPLVNGELFTITYNNAVLELVLDSFLLKSDLVTPVPMLTNSTVFGDGDHTLTFTPNVVVPIPSAIFLLGGGLIGLVAVRRRRS